MSSIRSILEELVYQLTDFTMEDIQSEKIKGHTKIDQALKDISELIDGAKPEIPVANSWQRGIEKAAYEDAIRVYQYKIKELLK